MIEELVTSGLEMSLELEAMPNNLVNYGVTENGIAIIELSSDSDGKPLTDGKTPVNTYTREMWEDIDTAILNARFDDKVTVILVTGKEIISFLLVQV